MHFLMLSEDEYLVHGTAGNGVVTKLFADADQDVLVYLEIRERNTYTQQSNSSDVYARISKNITT